MVELGREGAPGANVDAASCDRSLGPPYARGRAFSGAAIALYRFPPGARIRTPSGRYAYVIQYDEDERVYVRYAGDGNEQGCFPGRLLNQFSAAPDEKPVKYKLSTDVQHTCGHGDAGLEQYHYWRERTLPK